MSYRLVIFDFDGTLADSAPWFTAGLNALARRHRFRELSEAEIEMLRARSSREIVAYMGVPAWKLPRIGADMRRRMGEEAHLIPLFDGVPEMLRALKTAGLVLAVVSSNSEDNIRSILGPEPAACIDQYSCGAGLFGKAAKFRQVVRRCRVSPHQTLCIGDETRDIEAARAVGAASAAVAWGYATPEVLARFSPTMRFAEVKEIAPRLLQGAELQA